MSEFQQAKIALVQALGLSRDSLHVHIGLAVFFLAVLLLRRPLRSWLPIGAVVAAACAGEAWDLLDTHAAGDPLEWAKSRHDLLNTCFWPAVLFLLARFTRLLKR